MVKKHTSVLSESMLLRQSLPHFLVKIGFCVDRQLVLCFCPVYSSNFVDMDLLINVLWLLFSLGGGELVVKRTGLYIRDHICFTVS